MPSNPAFTASIGEWRTVVAALRHYQQYLDAALPTEFDDFERLDRLVPNFTKQLEGHLSEVATDGSVS